MNLWRFMERKAKDSELAEEIASHLAHDEDLRTACGMPADEAHRQARVKFGSQNAVRAEERRYRYLLWVETAQRDLIFELRSLKKTLAVRGKSGYVSWEKSAVLIDVFVALRHGDGNA
jgi:hypothetical protein